MKLQNIILLVATFFFSKSNAQHHHHHDHDSIHISSQIEKTSKDTVTQFNAVLTAYLDLKNALVMNDANKAATSAKSFMKAIDALDTKRLTNKQDLIWTMYAEKLSFDLEHIKGAPETEHQREHFVSLSKNLYEVAKVFKANPDDLYYQFCPMANDGKGAFWLSEQSKIRNPYFGKKMLSCGSTKETLQAAKR
ncbi:MAG: DUF3347 domain-containing protein [Saprospiraceae bacterium]|nr:DUF3347 domain-containing protein [Saprospiraceae bacterium]MBK8298730.1 DUF3347 domain-containing protein [Saprospiraceae bacterium]